MRKWADHVEMQRKREDPIPARSFRSEQGWEEKNVCGNKERSKFKETQIEK